MRPPKDYPDDVAGRYCRNCYNGCPGTMVLSGELADLAQEYYDNDNNVGFLNYLNDQSLIPPCQNTGAERWAHNLLIKNP